MHRILCIVAFFASSFAATSLFGASETTTLDGVWRIVADPDNRGRAEEWFARPLENTSTVRVPGVMQEVFPEYHGVAWYERDFPTSENPNSAGRTLLRFWQAEYRADVWLNGVFLGAHEGGEEAFELDATNALRPVGETNRLTVRVLNAADEPIDGISMSNVPRRNNTNVVTPGCGYASGGLVDTVEVVAAPFARIADLQLIPNWQTGEIEARTTFENYSSDETTGQLTFSATLVDGGETTRSAVFNATIKPGASRAVARFVVPDFKLWNLNDPNLYLVTADLVCANGEFSDRRTATCGFRDFRFERGYFRLNGKRIYVKCSHSGSDSPITHRVPLDPDFYRRDILSCKTMGFNMIRYIAGMPRRFQLDLCDRVGFLVYDECLAAWQYEACPERAARWESQTSAMIRRDRNHPSVVIWGLLNETTDAQLVLQAASFLKKARDLDPSRMLFLNSGGFDAFASAAAKTSDYAIWRAEGGAIMPGAIKNETDKTFFFDGTEWAARTFFLHPGDVGNEYAALKWEAPSDGAYRLDATFKDVVVHGSATVDLHLIKETTSGERVEIWNGFLNMNGVGKSVRLTSFIEENPRVCRIVADLELMKQAKVTTINFFDALREIPASYQLEPVETGKPIVVIATLRPETTYDSFVKATVVDQNGELASFEDFVAVEPLEIQDDATHLNPANFVFKRGEALFTIVGVGDGTGVGDTTAIDLRLTAEDGTVYDVNADFSIERNPNGAWSYGRIPAGVAPDLNSFALFEIGQKKLSFEPIGRFSNPYVSEWQNELADTHPYKPVPHSASVIEELRTHAKNGMPIFLSEYGVGSAVDLPRLTRLYEQYRAENAADAKHYRDRYDRFTLDWNRWKLDDVFPTQEEFFRQAIALMAEQRRFGINAIRSNPNVVAHSVTGTHDQGISGEGLTTIFRELKPGTVDAMADVFAPLRFCNFVEPMQAYLGQKIKIESVLVNEDVLPPGTYLARFVVADANNARVFDETREIVVPDPDQGGENPFAIPVFSSEFVMPVSAAEGECRFYAEFQTGAAASGGVERFYTFDRRRFPRVSNDRIFVWGDDQDLLSKLRSIGIEAQSYSRSGEGAREFKRGDAILVGATTNGASDADFRRLYELVAAGATAVFLSPAVFKEGADSAHYLPFEKNGEFNDLPNWLYHKDDWARNDAAFLGLQSGCVLDYQYYRDVIPRTTFKGQAPEPTNAISGAFSTQMGYDAGLSLAEWTYGQGRIIISTWLIQENLPSPQGRPASPIAERLLRNILVKALASETAP